MPVLTPTLSAGGSALVLWGHFCWCHIEGLNPSNCHCDASGKSHEMGKTRPLPWGAQPASEQPVDAANPTACPRACAGHLTTLTGMQRWPGGLLRPPGGEGSGTGGPGPRSALIVLVLHLVSPRPVPLDTSLGQGVIVTLRESKPSLYKQLFRTEGCA